MRRKQCSKILDQEHLQKLQRFNKMGIAPKDISFNLETEIVAHEQPEELTEEQTHGLKAAHCKLRLLSTCTGLPLCLLRTLCSFPMLLVKWKSLNSFLAIVPLLTASPFIEYFTNDDDNVSFYTGLPTFDTLELVYNFISPHIIRQTQSLSLFQEMELN